MTSRDPLGSFRRVHVADIPKTNHLEPKSPSSATDSATAYAIVGDFDTIRRHTATEWSSFLSRARLFIAEDPLFGPTIVAVAKDPQSAKFSSAMLARHGLSEFRHITVSRESRYFAAVENLHVKYKNDQFRRAAAITCLRTFANLKPCLRNFLTKSVTELPRQWDETSAGLLASRLKLLSGAAAAKTVAQLKILGISQFKLAGNCFVDVIYTGNSDKLPENNALVLALGQQLEQLFDPVTEYSPEPTERIYRPPLSPLPDQETVAQQQSHDSATIKSICQELCKVQKAYADSVTKFENEFLLPLRAAVLAGSEFGPSMAEVNSVFPRTIDEVCRINLLFSETLRAAEPFGSFEIVKACGIFIPNFYKICARHEAASRDFTSRLRSFLNEYSDWLSVAINRIVVENYTQMKIEALLHCGLNLARIKLILDRLVAESNWNVAQQAAAREYYKSAVQTIDTFGKQKTLRPYHRRVFTPSGKMLTELASLWPKELRIGWNTRRVVMVASGKRICGAEEMLNTNTEDLLVLFNDYLLILRVCDDSDSSATASASAPGSEVPRPSTADMLMHSLVNEAPLDDLPNLSVVGWAEIADIFPSTYGEGEFLYLFVAGEGLKGGNLEFGTTNLIIYRFPENSVNSSVSAAKFTENAVKAQILAKNQPFHLFRCAKNGLELFSVAHDFEFYRKEEHKSPISVFLHMPLSREVLTTFGLFAAFSLEICGDLNSDDNSNVAVHVTGLSILGDATNSFVKLTNLSEHLIAELSVLYSVYRSSANPEMTKSVVSANTTVAAHVLGAALPEIAEKTEKIAEETPEKIADTGNKKVKHQKSFLHALFHRKDSNGVTKTEQAELPSKKQMPQSGNSVKSVKSVKSANSARNVVKSTKTMEDTQSKPVVAQLTDAAPPATPRGSAIGPNWMSVASPTTPRSPKTPKTPRTPGTPKSAKSAKSAKSVKTPRTPRTPRSPQTPRSPKTPKSPKSVKNSATIPTNHFTAPAQSATNSPIKLDATPVPNLAFPKQPQTQTQTQIQHPYFAYAAGTTNSPIAKTSTISIVSEPESTAIRQFRFPEQPQTAQLQSAPQSAPQLNENAEIPIVSSNSDPEISESAESTNSVFRDYETTYKQLALTHSSSLSSVELGGLQTSTPERNKSQIETPNYPDITFGNTSGNGNGNDLGFDSQFLAALSSGAAGIGKINSRNGNGNGNGKGSPARSPARSFRRGNRTLTIEDLRSILTMKPEESAILYSPSEIELAFEYLRRVDSHGSVASVASRSSSLFFRGGDESFSYLAAVLDDFVVIDTERDMESGTKAEAEGEAEVETGMEVKSGAEEVKGKQFTSYFAKYDQPSGSAEVNVAENVAEERRS